MNFRYVIILISFILFISCFKDIGIGWDGLRMASAIFLLTIFSHLYIHKLVPGENIKYVWYCWILMISIVLGGDGAEDIADKLITALSKSGKNT